MALGILSKLERDLFGTNLGFLEGRTMTGPIPYEPPSLAEAASLNGLEQIYRLQVVGNKVIVKPYS